MNENELSQLVTELKISRDRILQEEAEMFLLDALAQDKISTNLVFYGGTALRLAYNSPRFSEDIDLIAIKQFDFTDFKNFITKTIKKQVLDWQIQDLKDKRQTIFALIQMNDTKLKHHFSVKIEIHKPHKALKLSTELRLLKSPVSIAEPLILVPNLTELKNLKISAIKDRKKARDIFDLWYITQLNREKFIPPELSYTYQERDFKNELKVFLPSKYYPVINQLYEHVIKTNTIN